MCEERVVYVFTHCPCHLFVPSETPSSEFVLHPNTTLFINHDCGGAQENTRRPIIEMYSSRFRGTVPNAAGSDRLDLIPRLLVPDKDLNVPSPSCPLRCGV